jgi:hypothetical protein
MNADLRLMAEEELRLADSACADSLRADVAELQRARAGLLAVERDIAHALRTLPAGQGLQVLEEALHGADLAGTTMEAPCRL